MQNTLTDTNKWTFAIFGLLAVIILTALTILGGIPSAERIPLFTLGTGLTIGITALIGAIGWHLLFRPLPAGHRVTRQLLITGRTRYFVSIVMVMGVINVALGALWDEIWHAKYGIPFGEDFFWPPHQMLYFGFIVTIVVAAWGFWAVMRQAKGTLQQRFRSDPALGFAIITGAYLAFALPADPIWHMFYGEDLAAWSLPHMVLLILVLVSAISAAAMQMSSQHDSTWQVLKKPSWRDIFVIMVFTAALLEYVIVLIVEWYVASIDSNWVLVLATRPDWLMPTILTFITIFIGAMALFGTRRIGVPTAMAILGLGVRFGVEQAIQAPYSGITPYAIILPLMLALDITHYVYLRRGAKPSLLITSVIVTATLAIIGLPLINQVFLAPTVTLSNVPLMIIFGFIATYAGLWMGEVVAGFLHQVESVESETEPAQTISLREQNWINGAVYASFGLFAMFLMLTAVPPI